MTTHVNIKNGMKIWWKKTLKQLGRIGKSLLFPIATLPFAAILLRLGAQIPTTTEFSAAIAKIILAAGNVVFQFLPVIFAVGIAFGLTKDHRGEAALSGFIGMMLVSLLMKSETVGVDLSNKIYSSVYDFHHIFGGKYDNILADNVLTGFIAGGLVAFIYNRYSNVKLPSALGFFSGRRLVPVLTILSVLIMGLIYAIIFPWIGWMIYKFSDSLTQATGNRYANAAIMGVYGIFNRLLIPFGLHHIPNTLFWFVLGSHPAADGTIVNGDINIFLNGVAEGNNAGTFQSGFFPIMMFGLPALAAAFYFTADNQEQKKRILSIFVPAAAISFLTGITEPIEFAFLFVAPGLFLLHAGLTGLFGFITGLFGIQLGFGFSAGLIDFMLSIPKSLDIISANKSGIDAVMANPGWIAVIGVLTSVTYFFVSKKIIIHWDLATPGRKNNLLLLQEEEGIGQNKSNLSVKAKKIILGLGGWDNIVTYDNCATRLRYEVKDVKKVDPQMIKSAGVTGTKIIDKTVHVIIGVTVEIINEEIIRNKGADLKI